MKYHYISKPTRTKLEILMTAKCKGGTSQPAELNDREIAFNASIIC